MMPAAPYWLLHATRSGASEDTLPQGVWQKSGHERRYGRAFKNGTAVSAGLLPWVISDRFANMLRVSSETHGRSRDVFAFGVYTGGSVRHIAQVLGSRFHRLYGFDSFSGLPHESEGLHIEGRHWKAGAFSASDALSTYDERALLHGIWEAVGSHPNVTLVSNRDQRRCRRHARAMMGIQEFASAHANCCGSRFPQVSGYLSESLPRMPLRQLRPALLVDIDVDLYVSAKQALRWVFSSGLAVAGTLVRYDDWVGGEHTNATWGEMRAHAEITREFGVRWRTISCDGRCSQAMKHCRLCEFQVVAVSSTVPSVGQGTRA